MARTETPHVAILLATYAGERFLASQLDSLAEQEGVVCTLLWRDDGSPDGTVAILDAFAARQPPGRVRRVTEPAGRLGAARSFLALLAAAPEDATCFAFCDQDDVWRPGKLARAAAALAEAAPDEPALYCGRQALAGPDLEPIGPSPDIARLPGFANALVQNIATGCTMVLNAAARRLVLQAPPPPEGSMHDWWCYLLVTAAGGRVIWDAEPQLLYRQHGANAVGATASPLVRAWRALRRGPDAFLGLLGAHMAALEQGARLSADARATLAALRPLHGPGPFRRLAALRQAGLYRQGAAEDLLLRLWVALRPLRRP